MISIDTNVMIWGVKEVATPGQEAMIPLAVQFFEHCKSEHITIAIPTQVLAEFLVDYTDEERAEQLEILSGSFFLPPFDTAAAAIAARLRHSKDVVDGVRKEFGLSRVVVKADLNIIATSVACGATKLIASDKRHMPKLAQGTILVDDLESFMAKERADQAARVAQATPPEGHGRLFPASSLGLGLDEPIAEKPKRASRKRGKGGR